MKRHEAWRAAYRADRYMADAALEAIGKRSCDINDNLLGPSDEGQLIPTAMPNQGDWWRLWTDVLEELALRGRTNLRGLVLAGEPGPWLTFPEPPRGIKILKGRPKPPAGNLIRLGEVAHMREAYTRGRFRIGPAASYADPSLNSAVQDDELSVSITQPGYRVKIREVQPSGEGTGIVLSSLGEVTFTRTLSENFYTLCFAHRYDARLLDDFNYDAVLAIHKVGQFARRMAHAVHKVDPALQMTVGAVDYYDPYRPVAAGGDIRMLKHFRYAYQRELRFVWSKPGLALDATPFFVEIGPMRDIAQLYLP